MLLPVAETTTKILPKRAHSSALQVPFPSLDRMLECDSEAEEPSSPVFHRALSLPPSTPSQRHQSRNGCPSNGLHLVTQYPVLNGNSTGGRQAEFASTLAKNLAHDQVSPNTCQRQVDESTKSNLSKLLGLEFKDPVSSRLFNECVNDRRGELQQKREIIEDQWNDV
jgi:hypothetical protein